MSAATNLDPIFEPVIEQAGFKLVRLRMMGGSSRTLQVMAERPDGSMDVEGCTILSHALLDFIEANDPVPGEYEIEVSSPGIDRPLTRPKDYERWAGHLARFETTFPVEGRRRFKGVLLGLENDIVRLKLDDGTEAQLPLATVIRAKLEITDALLAEHQRAAQATDAGAEPTSTH